MTESNRNCVRSRYHFLYEKIKNSGRCVYCGQRATGHDHFLPLSFVNSIADIDENGEIKKGRLLLLPCCLECNLLAGSKVFKTIGKKRRYIREALRKRYKRLLNTPDWDDFELDGLGPGLRKFTINSLKKRNHVRDRIYIAGH